MPRAKPEGVSTAIGFSLVGDGGSCKARIVAHSPEEFFLLARVSLQARHRRGARVDTVLARPLRAVERLVGNGDELVARRTGARRRNAEARRYAQAGAPPRGKVTACESVADPLRRVGGPLDVGP